MKDRYRSKITKTKLSQFLYSKDNLKFLVPLNKYKTMISFISFAFANITLPTITGLSQSCCVQKGFQHSVHVVNIETIKIASELSTVYLATLHT